MPAMRDVIDFSSWQGLLSTLFGLAVFSFIVVGIRLILMQTVQQRRERENRQINERLRTLIAAYKTLGGSFTGSLAVDPTHLRDLRANAARDASPVEEAAAATPSSDRRRRIRDAVEAALSDVILLGTQEQVRLAVSAANDMVNGRPVETAELVVSLRTFIRGVLDLDPIATGLAIPKQGPTRPGGQGARGGRDNRGGQGARRGGGGRSGGEGMGVLGLTGGADDRGGGS